MKDEDLRAEREIGTAPPDVHESLRAMRHNYQQALLEKERRIEDLEQELAEARATRDRALEAANTDLEKRRDTLRRCIQLCRDTIGGGACTRAIYRAFPNDLKEEE